MPAPLHRSRVLASPWPGVYATEIDSGRHYGRHWHTSYGFGVIDDGAHRSASGRGAVEAYAGDIVCANPGEVHDGRPLGAPSRRWRTVYVEPAIMASMLDAPDGAVAFEQPAFRDPQLRQALQQLLAAMQAWTGDGRGARTIDALACEQALAQACGIMLRDHSTASPCRSDDGAALGAVRDRLAQDPLDAPTLGELAALAGIGKFQLLRRFKKLYGVTPHDWLVQRRADRARALIRQGMDLCDTAAVCGFADQSHMTRVFVRRYGFTPGAWKQAH
jgi:AraC-like DNA-binding protein